MARSMPVEDAVSAGGVVWRAAGQAIEIVVCRRVAEDLWCLPKGTPNAGESLEETAQREVQEETGLEVALGDPLTVIEYWFARSGVRYHKRVHHWLMEPVGGDLAHHDHEFDDVVWMPADDALNVLTHENERRVVARALQRLRARVSP